MLLGRIHRADADRAQAVAVELQGALVTLERCEHLVPVVEAERAKVPPSVRALRDLERLQHVGVEVAASRPKMSRLREHFLDVRIGRDLIQAHV